MTSVVHTADVHLRRHGDDRWRALTAVLDLAEERSADLVTIGGDLFDRPADVDTLRPRLRNELFADRPFRILLIPGNHDERAFRQDLFFGDRCTVVAGTDPVTWTSDASDLAVWALPYHDRLTDRLAATLRERERAAETEALVFHGGLDAPVGSTSGADEDRRYFPVTAGELAALGFEYYLAGHYHDPHHRQLENGAEFAYPGTPAATTSAETGRRQAVTLTPGDPLGFLPLETPHHLEQRITVTPGKEDRAITALADWVDSTVTSEARPHVTVDGAVAMSETEFRTALEDVADPEHLVHEWIGVEAVASHPVLEEFADRLTDRDWDDATKDAVWVRTLTAAARGWR